MSERLWGILVDSFGKILLPGLTVTIPLTAISFTLALIIAVAVALVQFAHVPVLQRLARFYIWVIRGTPVLVQLFVVFYGLPGVGILIEPFPAAVLVFSINEGAYCAETIRAALESVPKGQMEAGQCVGMSYLQVIRRIILPQALRTAFPGQAAHDGQHLAGQLGVQSGRRLVEIDDLRVGGYGAGNRHALLLPAGKLAGVVVGAVIHADLDQRGAGDLLGPAARHFACDDKPLGHVLQCGLVGKQVVALKDKSRAAAQGVGLGVGDAGQVYALVVKQHRAAVGLFQKVQAAQHRCFSAAAGA